MSFKAWPRKVAAGALGSPSHESAQCRRCGDRLWFGTDGNGKLVEQCPHCDWGHPLPVAPPVPVCKHGVAQDQRCDACVAERHRHADAIRDGVAKHYAQQHKDRAAEAAWFARRSAAAKRSWETLRSQGRTNQRKGT